MHTSAVLHFQALREVYRHLEDEHVESQQIIVTVPVPTIT